MSVSSIKIESVIEKLRVLCQYAKPKIDYIFYFSWKRGPEYTCGIGKPSKKFLLMANVIRSKGKLVDQTRAHLEKHPLEDPMDLDGLSAARHTGNFAKISASVEQAIRLHNAKCPECTEKWSKLKLVKEPEIETWNEYVREVKILKGSLESAKFCISIDEHFPHKDDLLEFGSEYFDRVDEIISMFEFIGDETYYFIAEYMDRQSEKMIIWQSSNKEEGLPGGEYLNTEMI